MAEAQAERERGSLSDWLELMLAEIGRRQEEAQAGLAEQAARAATQVPPPDPHHGPSHSPHRGASHTTATRPRNASRRVKLD